MSGRKRFTLSDGIALVKKVLYVNPFLDPARWMKITDRLSEVLGRCFTIRSVRERLNLIFLRFCEIRRRKLRGNSGTEEEQSELEDLLQQAADIARECGYTPPPSTARQLAERDDIEKRATRNSVACPPAKRCVDNGEEDALAAYAELTVGDGVEPADGASTSQAQTLLNSMYEPENIEIHIYLPDCELEDNRTASCPAPDCITTAAPSRAQTPASSPSDVAVAEWPVDSQQRRAQSSPCSPLTAGPRTSTPVHPRATPIRGPQRYAETTYALIEARCDRDTAIENHHLQLEEDRLRFEMKRHEEKMKLKEMELQQRQAEQEAKFKLTELELEALA
ncbi:hypothetical protein MRX96_017366 [Rhipicephalus microplus]